jgi:mono/diheme cytochrome c family protein
MPGPTRLGRQMRAKRLLGFAVVFCCFLALAAGGLAVIAWQPAIAPIVRPPATSFDPGLVKRGAELAAIGNCDVCHTVPGGRESAGGRAVPTPFGTIYSTNITPDDETGIGNWPEAAFRRAMRLGVRRDGAYLYPAFPYDHFTLVSDDDDKALYAYLMTRPPIRAAAPADKLPFPLDIRLVMFGWNLLFLHPGPYRAGAARDASSNRGAYLAEGLGHCGACHTPRNALGAEKPNRKFAGSVVDGWTAYALNAASPAPVPWNAEALDHYLRHGFDENHGVARGPMADVADDLRSASAEDVRAIATYVAKHMNHAVPENDQVVQQVELQDARGKSHADASADSQSNTLRAVDTENDEGAVIYAGACAGCHEGPRALPYGGIDLALSSAISGPSAGNLVNIVLYGLPAAEAVRAPIMPGFAAAMNDAQVAALARYLRARFSDKGPWTAIARRIHDARSRQRVATASHAPADAPAPSGTAQRTNNEAQRQ